jgi:hypothetical protein
MAGWFERSFLFQWFMLAAWSINMAILKMPMELFLSDSITNF